MHALPSGTTPPAARRVSVSRPRVSIRSISPTLTASTSRARSQSCSTRSVLMAVNEPAGVSGWAQASVGTEAGPQVCRGTEAAAVCNDRHTGRALLQQAAGEFDSLAGKPRQRCRAQLGPEAPVQGGDTDVGSSGEVGDRQGLVEPFLGPG